MGNRVVELLIEPAESTREALAKCTLSIDQSGEGLFLPLYGGTGAGKTTFANQLASMLPREFSPTVIFNGTITYDTLTASLSAARQAFPTNDRRITPINIDDRESAPPTPTELAAIKRFLRSPSGARSLIFWPETNKSIADTIATAYQSIGGAPPISIPMSISGPDRSTWQDIAINTLHLCNEVSSLEDLGTNPRNYTPESYPTLGEFLKKISLDFVELTATLLKATQRPLSVVFVIASQTADAGSLAKFTTPGRPGFLDANGLLKSTPESTIGKWWAERRGLLVQTIYKLNARAFSLAPAASITVLRAFGPNEVKDDLIKLGIGERGAAKVTDYLARSDLGKYLILGDAFSFEDRGTPAEDADQAFQLISESAFTSGKDKKLNVAMRDALRTLLNAKLGGNHDVRAEQKLDFCPLIPDNAIHKNKDVICVEYTWRKGDYLASGNKSAAAQYILTKLRNYATELGWVAQ